MTPIEHVNAIETALMRIHCLSKAINLILANDDDVPSENGSTFRAAIEEVNDCSHEAMSVAVGHLEKLADELNKGGAA